MKTHTKTLLAALTASTMLAGSANAAVVVNNQIQGTPLYTVQGTLLAVDAPTTQGANIAGPQGPTWPVAADVGFTIGSGVTLTPDASRIGWEPDGTVAGTAATGYLSNAAGTQVSWTFDIPDGSIVHGVYSHWFSQANSGSGHTMGYDEGTPTVMIRPASPTGNLILGWTDSASNLNNRNFERLFEGPITVAGGDGFTVTFTHGGGGFPYIDAVVIDYIVPESPSSSAFDLTITPATAPDTGFDLAWASQSGKLYNLRTSNDLTGAISTWTLVEGDIEANPPTNTANVDPADSRRFCAVEEFDAPPVE